MGRWVLLALLPISGCIGNVRGSAATPSAVQAAPAATPGPTRVCAPPNCRADAQAQGGHVDRGSPGAPEVDDADDEEIDDGIEVEGEAPPGLPSTPRIALSDAEIAEKAKNDLASLGSMSVGMTSAGALVNGVQMPPENERWTAVDRNNAWGTRETIDAIIHAIDVVFDKFPDTPRMYVGHVSSRSGGHLWPHVSHQAGRDVDLSYYLTGNHKWYARATARNLDRARTWAFVRTLITDTDVELILIDTSVQRLLKEYAASIGEDAAWLDRIFQVGSKAPQPLIRHAKGHATHLHVRFYSPLAQEMARRAYPMLVARGTVKGGATTQYVTHTARKGDTLGALARRYGCTVAAIREANGLRSSAIRAKVTYKIPKRGARRPLAPNAPLTIPPRRLPPNSGTGAGARAEASR